MTAERSYAFTKRNSVGTEYWKEVGGQKELVVWKVGKLGYKWRDCSADRVGLLTKEKHAEAKRNGLVIPND